MSDWFLSSNTDPQIAEVMLQRLREWLHGSPPEPLPCVHPSIQAVAEAQDAVGWELPFSGFWLQAWCPLQQIYFERALNSPKTGKTWLSQLIRKLYDMAWALWTHRNDVLHRQTEIKEQLALVTEIRT
ncbi:MAG TPA: hypothetical protein V6D20_07760, partial [Candidatus Obscuribacterales bacterium]